MNKENTVKSHSEIFNSISGGSSNTLIEIL